MRNRKEFLRYLLWCHVEGFNPTHYDTLKSYLGELNESLIIQ